VPTLQEALQSFSKTLPAFPTTSDTSQLPDTTCQPTPLMTNGQNSETITSALVPSTPALTSAGILGAVTLPNGKEEARRLLLEYPDKVALSATTLWLPPKVAQWLNSSETAPKDMEGRPLRPVTMPTLREEERKQLAQALWMLDQVMKPASTAPDVLMEAIQVAMSELRYRSKGEEQHTLNLKVWMNACQQFPMWAVQKAADWWSKGARDGDELGHFLKDVRLAVGGNVLARISRLRMLNQ
jgi:hypothetical protein